jgi:uncharacterized protein (DUF302 family)
MAKLQSLELIIQKSPHSVAKTVERLQKSITAKGMIIFAVIDHSSEARKAYMDLNEEKLLIFGDPKAGTFLMQENPSIGIELPLRLLIWQNEKKLTQIAYVDSLSLAENYHILHHVEVLRKMSSVLALMVAEATQEEREGEVKI